MRNYLNNMLSEYGWHIEFEPLFDKEVFWNVVERYKGKIKALEFVYYVPNLFGTDDKVSNELEGAKQIYSAQKVETKLVNEDGNLEVPKNQFINESIELVHKGGGKYFIHIKGYRKKISSETEVKLVELADVEIDFEDKEGLEQVLSKLFK